MDIYSRLATCVHLSCEFENHIVLCKIAFISKNCFTMLIILARCCYKLACMVMYSIGFYVTTTIN